MPEDLGEMTESRLVALAKQGSRDAYDELFGRHRDALCNHLARILRDRPLADDVTQDCYLKCLDAIQSFELTRPFLPWIIRVGHNLAMDFYRARARERAVLDSPGVGRPSPEVPEQQLSTDPSRARARHQDLLVAAGVTGPPPETPEDLALGAEARTSRAIQKRKKEIRDFEASGRAWLDLYLPEQPRKAAALRAFDRATWSEIGASTNYASAATARVRVHQVMKQALEQSPTAYASAKHHTEEARRLGVRDMAERFLGIFDLSLIETPA